MNDPSHRSCCAAHAEGLRAISTTMPYRAALTVKDPVCGMNVDPHRTPHRHELRGQTYYFCSAGCRTKFAADPDRYLGDKVPAPARPDAIYTCPMHPEVRQVGPGQLPDLRHGARAGGRDGRDRAEPRARRHDPAVLDRAGAGAAGAGPRDGRASHQPAHAPGAAGRRTGCSSSWRPRWSSGPGGRSSSAAGRR